jgi:hypothetical protein
MKLLQKRNPIDLQKTGLASSAFLPLQNRQRPIFFSGECHTPSKAQKYFK